MRWYTLCSLISLLPVSGDDDAHHREGADETERDGGDGAEVVQPAEAPEEPAGESDHDHAPGGAGRAEDAARSMRPNPAT